LNRAICAGLSISNEILLRNPKFGTPSSKRQTPNAKPFPFGFSLGRAEGEINAKRDPNHHSYRKGRHRRDVVPGQGTGNDSEFSESGGAKIL
jgi:hypothetical protein